MFLALLLVCNSLGKECQAIMAPEFSASYEDCKKELAVGAEFATREKLIVKDLVCVQFSSGA